MISKNKKIVVSEATQLEIIDSSGRSYITWTPKNTIELLLDGEILKIYIK